MQVIAAHAGDIAHHLIHIDLAVVGFFKDFFDKKPSRLFIQLRYLDKGVDPAGLQQQLRHLVAVYCRGHGKDRFRRVLGQGVKLHDDLIHRHVGVHPLNEPFHIDTVQKDDAGRIFPGLEIDQAQVIRVKEIRA